MATNDRRPARVTLDLDHFFGHRRSPRRRCVMPVDCLAGGTTYAGRTVDLSRLGALVELRDPKFTTGAPTLVEFARRVAEALPKRFVLSFAEPPVRVAARVARVTRHPSADSLLVGCAFANPLTDRQCRAFGLPTEDLPEEPLPAE